MIYFTIFTYSQFLSSLNLLILSFLALTVRFLTRRFITEYANGRDLAYVRNFVIQGRTVEVKIFDHGVKVFLTLCTAKAVFYLTILITFIATCSLYYALGTASQTESEKTRGRKWGREILPLPSTKEHCLCLDCKLEQQTFCQAD